MPTVLVTGSSGQIGAEQVLAAAHGCDVIVHAGAIARDTSGTPDDIVATNVLGTWHVLSAAEQRNIDRVVYFSSGQVFGSAEGEGMPDYVPIDDRHPLRAARPYRMSKRLAEGTCEMWTARTGATTIVLRPVMVLTDDGLASQAFLARLTAGFQLAQFRAVRRTHRCRSRAGRIRSGASARSCLGRSRAGHRHTAAPKATRPAVCA